MPTLFAVGCRDCLFIATNNDPTFPWGELELPGCGTMVSAITTAVGRQPDAILGKPDSGLASIFCSLGLDLSRTVMVGDRLDTDIVFGSRHGMPTLLVLSGVTSPAEASAALGEARPSWVANDVGHLASLLLQAEARGALPPPPPLLSPPTPPRKSGRELSDGKQVEAGGAVGAAEGGLKNAGGVDDVLRDPRDQNGTE
jgi:hypothetical protein